MHELDETEERFVTLETKVAFLERLIDELNGVIIEQGTVLDEYKARIGKLENSIRDGLFEKPAHERPPHY